MSHICDCGFKIVVSKIYSENTTLENATFSKYFEIRLETPIIGISFVLSAIINFIYLGHLK